LPSTYFLKTAEKRLATKILGPSSIGRLDRRLDMTCMSATTSAASLRDVSSDTALSRNAASSKALRISDSDHIDVHTVSPVIRLRASCLSAPWWRTTKSVKISRYASRSPQDLVDL
jgi:hypothetical protein